MSMDIRFLHGHLNGGNPDYKKTIESLTAQIAYNSLSEKEKIDYAVYSQFLDKLFFNLSEDELATIEQSLPPYSKVLEYVYNKKGISKEDLSLSSKKISKIPFFNYFSYFNKNLGEIREARKRLEDKIVTEDYKNIKFERSKKLSKDIRKLSLLFYSTTVPLIYLNTKDPILTILWLSPIFPYYALSYASYYVKDRKISNYLRKSAVFYSLFRNPIAFSLSILEFGLGAQFLGNLIEKAWPYTPKNIRKFIDISEKYFSGIKIKPFDEREIRKELYENSKIIKTSLPKYIIDEFRDKLENGIIEIENPRETLFKPYLLGYHDNRIVLEKDGKEWKIIDREYVRRLADKYGKFIKDFEEEIVRRPWEYLVFDVKRLDNGIIPVYSKDVIGIYNFKNDGLRNGIAFKEIESCFLSLYANNLSLIYGLPFDEFKLKYILGKNLKYNF
jgi:hypothetical protein